MKTGFINQDYLVLSPAYGRDYTSAKACLADFELGKDFIFESVTYGRRYCSSRDFMPNVKVELRYAKLTKVVIATTK